MAGDPSNAALWEDANVYVSFNLAAATPADADTPFGVDWDLVGLLDGDQGFTAARNQDVSDKYAWGQRLVRTSRRNFKTTKTFTALEANETTHRLQWPGSSGGELVIPVVERCKIAFETIEGDYVHRLISYYEAEVELNGDVNENEPDLATLPFIATIYPGGTDGKTLWIEQESEVGS